MKLRNRYVIRGIAYVLAVVLRLGFRLIRWRIIETVPGTCAYRDTGSQRFLYCIWHDAILGVIFARQPRWMAGLVSLHADGSYVADAMQACGIRPIRGSSGRRGAGAVREMMQAVEDWHIAIATDGPRGPQRQVKDGIVYVASQTGRLILPVAITAKHAWRPRGRWTDMTIPLPFTKAWFLIGTPIAVPADLRPAQLAEWRERLQQAMDDLDEQAQRMADSLQEPVIRPFETDAVPRQAA